METNTESLPPLCTDKPIQIARWAGVGENGELLIPSGLRSIQMHSSDGSGDPLLKDGDFGADVIRFPAGKGVSNHTHVGAHILFVLSGKGYVEYNGEDNLLQPGVCYLVPSMVDHAIKAETELVLLVVGNDHRTLEDKARLDMVN